MDRRICAPSCLMPLLFVFIYLFLNMNNVGVTLAEAPFIN